ncbi:MAG: DUF4363 family protein [Clostridium sp.]|nr:DUF4363 family protein [Clostridium sp.]
MKNSLLSIFIFLVLISFLFYSDMEFKNLCADTIKDCEFLEYGLSSENEEQSFEAAMIIFSRLDEKNIIPSIYINHLDYDVLLNEALKLTVYIEQDDMSEASASLHLLKFAAQHIKELQVPNLKNIF